MKKFFVLAMVIAVVLFRCLVVGQTMADFKEAFRKKAQEKKDRTR